jgi:hypothetical protein
VPLDSLQVNQDRPVDINVEVCIRRPVDAELVRPQDEYQQKCFNLTILS